MVIPPNVANVSDESAKGQMKFYVPNYNDGYVSAAPVGSFKKELSGLYDIAGNVSEWVHDIYSIMPPIEDTTSENPLGCRKWAVTCGKRSQFPLWFSYRTSTFI